MVATFLLCEDYFSPSPFRCGALSLDYKLDIRNVFLHWDIPNDV